MAGPGECLGGRRLNEGSATPTEHGCHEGASEMGEHRAKSREA